MNAVFLNESGENIVRRTMGAYKVADMMRSDGWTVEVLDWISRWSNEEIKQFVDSLPYEVDLFGISNLWMQDDMILEKIAYIKDNYPNAKILMGGPKPYQIDYGADVMVYGYSEYALRPVLDWMFNKSLLHPKGKYPEWAPNSYLVDANENYTGLDIEKFDVEYTSNDFIEPEEALTLELSRGCKFKCKYCNHFICFLNKF